MKNEGLAKARPYCMEKQDKCEREIFITMFQKMRLEYKICYFSKEQ